MSIQRKPLLSRLAGAVIVAAAVVIPAVGLSAGTAYAYSPNGDTAAGKTDAEAAQDCNSPETYQPMSGTNLSGFGLSAAIFPQCAVTATPGAPAPYTSIVNAPEDPSVSPPNYACSMAGGGTGASHSVTATSGFIISGSPLSFGGELSALFDVALAPTFGWEDANSVSSGWSETANVPWDSVGWLDASLQVGVGTYNVTATYLDGSTHKFTAQAEILNPAYQSEWTSQSRVMSEAEYDQHCNNSPVNVSGLNTLSATSAGWYPSNGRIVNSVLNNMCLDDTNRSTQPGTQQQIWACQGGANGTGQTANQTWNIQLEGSAFVVKNSYSGLCLDDLYSKGTPGNPVDGYTCNGTNAQKWYYNQYAGTVTPNANPQPVYELVSADNPSLCAVPDGTNNGALMVLGSCGQSTGVPLPVFSFTQPGTAPVAQAVHPTTLYGTSSGRAFSGALVNFGTGKCLDDTNWSTAAWTQQQIWDCTGGGNQAWTLGSNGTISNGFSGLCLDVYANSASSPPVPAIQYGCDASDQGQVFTLKLTTFPGLPEGYEIVNDHGMCLDVNSDSATDGNTVDWYPCNRTGAQDWYFS